MMSIKRVILCCAVLMCFTLSRSQNNFFMAKQYSSENYICVTNTSYALSWIREDIEEPLDFVSTYIPKTNGIDYDIKNDYNTVQYFQKESWSIEYSYGDLILDERWEEFKVTKIEAREEYNATLLFYHVLNNLKDNFEVFFSIRVREEGHVFLCDEENPTKSNCYWLLLQGFKNGGTAIRKCGRNQLPGIQGRWPKEPCSIKRVEIKHPEVPRYLSEKRWSHFVLSKRENTLTFSKIVDFQKITIMEWQDPDSPISVKNMFVHSKRVNGLWKIHSVDYIVTTQESKDVHLGPLIYAADGLICISMYVAMCPSCKMKFSLAVDNVIIHEEFYESQGRKWTKIKLVNVTSNPNVISGIKLLVSTIGSLKSSFWAIDKIRQCRPQEFRQFVLAEPSTCQLMSAAKDVISFRKSTTPFPQIDNNCPETTIGPFCVPCDWILDHCERIKFCTKDECQCSAGYTGDSCYEVCDTQKYGHGCKKTCGKCYYGHRYGHTCNAINGECPSQYCSDDYIGPKCDRPSTVIFAKAPKVINVTYSSAIIQITDFEVKDWPEDHTFSQYIIEYKEVEDIDWMHLQASFRFYDFSNITIDNLKSDTKYLVRRVIISGDKWQLGDHLLSTEFKTLCIEISDSNIMVETQNTSASILIIQITDIMCKSHMISMDNGRSPVFRNGTFAYFTDLTPFTEYTVIIENQNFVLEKTIKTTERVPSLVRDLTVSPSSSTTVELKWKKPEIVGGEFKQYVVEYQHINYMDCSFNTSEQNKYSERTTNNFATIKNLIPYSKYIFSVVASNTKFDGPPKTQLIDMPPSDTIESEEIPKIYNTTTSIRGARTALIRPPCESSRGPLTAQLTLSCLSEWCPEQTRTPKTKDEIFYDNVISINYLTNFTDYTLDLKFCRLNGQCSEPERITFKTEPAAPGPVRDLLVYTKNESSISLRWKPPYPPNGILEEYMFQFKRTERTGLNIITTGVKPCKLWPKFHCETITNLRRNTLYTLSVSGKNKNATDFGKFTYNVTQTRTEPSARPYDIHVKWTKENNLQLDWKHPNQTNGAIKYFRIYVTNTTENGSKLIEDKLELSQNEYNLTYYHKVNATLLFPATVHYVYFSANNGQDGQVVFCKTTTPPDIPSLSANVTFSSTDNNITVSSSVQEIRGNSDSHRMIILRSDKQTNVNMFQELGEFDLSDLKVVVDCNITKVGNISFNITIGNDQQFNDSYICEEIDNFLLDPGTSYNVSIALINSFNGKFRINIYSYSVNTTGQPLSKERKSGLFALLILLLLILLAAILYFKRKQLISLKSSIFKENNTCNNRMTETQLSTLQPSANTHNISHNINSLSSKDESNSIDSNTISAKKLKNFIKQSVQNQELKKQYMSLVNTITTYDTVLDTFRVEYVDVEYKKKFRFNKAYIVCKAPTLREFEEFWEIVWYENVKHLIFLEDVRTTVQTSLNNYWPDQNKSMCYGNITVKCNTCQISNFCICRQFTIQAKNISKQIFQLHLCLPQDDYFYLSSLNYIVFFQKLSQIPYSATSPILVHSSSGLKGASFTLLCDISLKFLKEEGGVNVMQELQKLIRISPELMIDYEHYLAAHAVIFEILCQIKTSIDCRSSEHLKQFDKNDVQKHLKYLRDTLWLDVINAEEYDDRYIYFQADSTKCDGTLQCKAVSIDKENCPFLKNHKLFKINDFKTSRKFCVTQQPTADTMDDFLDLIIKHQISFVVILNHSLQMWPTPRTPVMKINADVVVKHQETKNLKTYDWIIVKISNNSVEYTIKILIFKNWIPPAYLPDLTDFVEFVIESKHLCKDSESILVTCFNGVTASGLYVAMSYSFRQIEEENVCDVCTSIRIIRRYYEDFLKEDEQYEFLLEAVYKYMQQSSIYTEIEQYEI